MSKIDLTPKQRQLVRNAILRACQWEESLADAWGGSGPEAQECYRLIRRFKKLGRKFTVPRTKAAGETTDGGGKD
jgi:hypothetical protein